MSYGASVSGTVPEIAAALPTRIQPEGQQDAYEAATEVLETLLSEHFKALFGVEMTASTHLQIGISGHAQTDDPSSAKGMLSLSVQVIQA